MTVSLVTGGGGFIGTHLVAHLISEGHQVRVIDDFSNGLPGDLPIDEIELVEADITYMPTLEAAVQGANVVFHQAAMVSVPGSIRDPARCYDVNVNGTLNVLSAASRAGIRRVVLASSAAVYGESDEPVAEDAPKQPMSPYAASKWAMEQAASMFHQVYGLETVCLRYFNVYGAGQRPDSPYAAVIPNFIDSMLDGTSASIYGDGEQRRDFVHVSDVVRANLLAAEDDSAVGVVLNISGGNPVSINELAGILQEIIPDAPAAVHGPPREGDIYFSEAVIQRAHQALGYRPEVALAEGLRSTVEWFRQGRLAAPQ